MKLARSAPLLRRSALRSRPKRRKPSMAEQEARVACLECGAPITRSKTGRCRSCAAIAARAKRDRGRIEKTCPICGEIFLIMSPAAEGKRRTCSRACAAEWKRRRGGVHRTGILNPNYRSGKRAGVRDRAGEARWREALGDRCMAPNCETPLGVRQPLFLHHVCYRQHVEKASGDTWDPQNALTICNRCHARHHRRSGVLPISALPDSALVFAVGLFGEYAIDYLRRYYEDDGDPRLTALGSAP